MLTTQIQQFSRNQAQGRSQRSDLCLEECLPGGPPVTGTKIFENSIFCVAYVASDIFVPRVPLMRVLAIEASCQFIAVNVVNVVNVVNMWKSATFTRNAMKANGW